MFNLLTDAIENGLDIISGLTEGETPSKRQVAQLISDGVTVVAIAEATGFAVETIQSILDEDEQ